MHEHLDRATARAWDPARTLACTEDGIFIWPGVALVRKRGEAFVCAPEQGIYNLAAALHGPAVIYSALVPTLRRAAQLLEQGRDDRAKEILARLALPALSGSGAALAQAIVRRLGIASPAFAVSWDSSGAALTPALADKIAAAFHGVAADARRLEKVFNPTLHPRWPSGAPDSQGGQFSPGNNSDNVPVVPVQWQRTLLGIVRPSDRAGLQAATQTSAATEGTIVARPRWPGKISARTAVGRALQTSDQSAR